MMIKKATSHFLKIFSLVIFAIVTIVGINTAFAAAGVPATLSYQGRLTSPTGSPVVDGDPFWVCFSLYDAASGGNKLWPPATPPTPIRIYPTNGVFNTQIGGGTDSLVGYDFASSSPEYLNVGISTSASCAGAENLSPRQPIDATAYARVAENVYGGTVQVGTGTGTASQKLLKLDWKNTSDTLGGGCSPKGSMWYNSNSDETMVCANNIIQALVGRTSQFLGIAFGGTGTSTAIGAFNALSPITTKGDIISSDGTNDVRLAVGTDGQALTASSTTASGLAWATISGGGGSPGGADTNIQFNNAGAFGGSADFTWNNTTKDLTLGGVDTGITYNGITNEPAAPAAGDLHMYAKNVGGRMLPKWIGPSGVDVAVQPALFGNNIALWVPNTGTTVSLAFGTSWTARNSGTAAAQSTPTIASTNLSTSMKRACFGTGTTTTGSSGTQSSQLLSWRGNAAGLGGFFFFARVAVDSTYVNTVRMMTGLSAQNAVLNAQPSTINNSILLGKDSADTTWQIILKGTGAVTKINTGVTIASGQVMDLYINARPNDNKVTIRLVQQLAGSQTVIIDNVDYVDTTYNLPATNVFLYARHAIQSTAGTTAKLYCLNRIYVESDI
ncbi:MAG: hypothetical protein WC791_02920 [Candidatus Paceibacterota bacterium]